MKNRIIYLCLLCSLVIAVCYLCWCSDEETIDREEELPAAEFYMPDIKLEAAIREELGKLPRELLTIADMEQLVDLIADNKGIMDIRGLEYAVNLVDLRLCNNQIADLEPLGNLTAIYRLHLSNNLITDITPLSSLSYLEDLKLDGNRIADISPLNNNKSLRWVDLINNEIEDISAFEISGLPLLGYVNLSGNKLDPDHKKTKAKIDELAESIPDLRY